MSSLQEYMKRISEYAWNVTISIISTNVKANLWISTDKE